MIEIQPMQVAEIESVRNLERQSGLRSFDRQWFERELMRDEGIFLVARTATGKQDEQIVGSISGWVVADEWHIDNLVVAASHRGRGLAAALVGKGARRASNLGACRAVLEVRTGNLAAIALYARLGFVETGRRREYYRDPVEDAQIMICDGEDWSRLVD